MIVHTVLKYYREGGGCFTTLTHDNNNDEIISCSLVPSALFAAYLTSASQAHTMLTFLLELGRHDSQSFHMVCMVLGQQRLCEDIHNHLGGVSVLEAYGAIFNQLFKDVALNFNVFHVMQSL